MRQSGIVAPQFFFERVECFLRFALARDDAKCPIADFLAASEPFVGPRKQNGSGKAAPDHAVDMPAEHLRLLVL